MEKTVGAGAEAEIFCKLKPETHENGPAPKNLFF
jgi:hypothetical protein